MKEENLCEHLFSFDQLCWSESRENFIFKKNVFKSWNFIPHFLFHISVCPTLFSVSMNYDIVYH